ncbi:MAG: SRPBCC family protein [Acidimicrobiales bacterium]|nr:SRPBCC family protein [Acidimicrobiales bacterium]
MHTVTVSSHVPASPDTVWSMIGDPASISSWHPAIAESPVDGDMRKCTLADGAEIHERIEQVDEASRAFTYTITESPLPLSDYRSTIQVDAEGSGSVVEWTASFEPVGAPIEDVAELLKGVYSAGLGALRAEFG